jgi:hypothetical protein
MIRAVMMRIDGGCRIVSCPLRERRHALQTRNAFELRFCVAQLCGQCGMLGAFRVEQLSFEIIRLVVRRRTLGAQSQQKEKKKAANANAMRGVLPCLARFRPSATKAFVQCSSALEALQRKLCF